MSRIKPVRVETSDGRVHEVDIRLIDKIFTAWGFVDQSLIQGVDAASQLKAVANWKKEYQTLHA